MMSGDTCVTDSEFSVKINQLDHYNFNTDNPAATLDFYTRILGLESAPKGMRPSTKPGAWIMIGDRAGIHINFVDHSHQGIGGDTGPIDHIAFDATDHSAFENVFTENDIEYRKVARPEINLVQLFLHDPNGIKIEINIRNEL